MTTTFAIILLASTALAADDPPKPATPTVAVAGPTFRLSFQQFDSGRRLVGRGEVIASRGKLYYLEKNSNEVVIIEPGRKALRFVDIKLGISADLAYRELDAEVAAGREEHRKAVEAHARSASRGERIDAEMRRDMSDPRFQVRYDEAARTLYLANPTAQVEARGEPDDDAARFAAIAESLRALAKLHFFRDPDNLKHLIEIEAVSSLVDGRKLRPAEMTYLFRLAGPPEKHRWVFTLVPEVTEQDRQGLDLIEARLQAARRVTFDRYDRRADPDELK